MSDPTPAKSLQDAYEQLKSADAPAAEPKLSASDRRARTVARLAAVQALYQMEVGGAGVDAVVREFSDYRFERDMEGAELAHADEAYFAEVVRDAVASQGEVDRAIATRLAKGWRLDRIDATLRAILRAGAAELIKRPDTPLVVVIDEYVEIAKSFFEGPEPGVVNGVLDGIARDVRG